MYSREQAGHSQGERLHGDPSASCGTRKTAPSAGARNKRSPSAPINRRFGNCGIETKEVACKGRNRTPEPRRARSLSNQVRLSRSPPIFAEAKAEFSVPGLRAGHLRLGAHLGKTKTKRSEE